MTRVRFVRRDGFLSIEAVEHTRPDVCAAISMMMQACALGLEDLERQFPSQIKFEYFGGTDMPLRSTDTRKRRKKKSE